MDEITFHLSNYEDFEGPLDLILQLLSKNKMTIANLNLTEILAQYLQQVEQMDLDTASEFTVMASHLVYLKSRMLINAGEDSDKDDLKLLLKALEERRAREEYEKILIAVAFIEPLSHIGREVFSRQPFEIRQDKTYSHRHSPAELQNALGELHSRIVRRTPPKTEAFSGILGVEPFPVNVKSEQLLHRLSVAGRISMKNFFREQGSRSELIAAFLAILELCKDGKIHTVVGDDIEIYAGGGDTYGHD